MGRGEPLRGREGDPAENAQQGAFACAVRSEYSKNLALAHGERDVVERPEIPTLVTGGPPPEKKTPDASHFAQNDAVALGYVLDFNPVLRVQGQRRRCHFMWGLRHWFRFRLSNIHTS